MEQFEKLCFTVESATAANNRAELKKPNEDLAFFDAERGIFLLLDGITRVHREYDERPYESAATEVGTIFLQTAYTFMLEHIREPDPEWILRGAVAAANAKLRDYRACKSQEEWGFYPATLGFVSLLRGHTLHYIGVGDCMAVLLRKNAKILLGKEWALEALDKQVITKSERYGLYCNHPENPLSYTVFNGDELVLAGLDCSFIDLHRGDTLLIASDGIGDYIKYEKSKDLLLQSPAQMIALSSKYDAPPYATYADDKTILKITF